MINRNNYEAYLIDYLDGKLSAVEVSEVLLFLEQHPHIKEELNGLKEMHLSEQDLPGPDFSSLMKPTYKDEKQKFEALIIGKIEGDTTPEEDSLLQKGLQLYPELVHDNYLFEQTKLTPDTTIIFPNKNTLKKGGWIVPLFQSGYSRAAAIALLAVGVWMLMNVQPQQEKSLANIAVHNGADDSITYSTKEPVTDTHIKRNIVPIQKSSTPNTEKHTQPIQQIAETETKEMSRADTLIKSIYLIDGMASSFSQDLAYEFPKLDFVNAFVPNRLAEANETDFPTIGNYLKNNIKNGTRNWLAKNELNKSDKVITTINKITGANIVFEKDSQTNIINKFEVAGIGIAWSGKK